MQITVIDHMKDLPTKGIRGYQMKNNADPKEIEEAVASYRHNYGVEPLQAYAWNGHFLYIVIEEETK